MKRREFLGGGLAALGIGALLWKTWAEKDVPPDDGLRNGRIPQHPRRVRLQDVT